jgi:predicted Zn-dependent protease
MSATQLNTALDTANRVLDLVRDRAGDAEVEVTVGTGEDALTRFANSFIHQNVVEEVSHVVLRVALDGRVASTSFDGAPDEAGLTRLVDNVLEAARVAPSDNEWPGLAPRADAPDPEHWDEATASAAPDERAQRVADFVGAGEGLETAGACQTTAVTTAFANSAGQRLTGRATLASIDGIARTGTSDGSARMASARLGDIDGGKAGALAARKARDAADPGDLEPGRYEVVLEPQCVADLLLFLGVYGFNAKAVEEGRSFVRLGEQQFDPAITLVEDPGDTAQVGIGFDAEGTPKRRLELVRDGVTRGTLHTRRTARKAGVESTGHAVEGGEGYGAVPTNPVLAAGTRSTEELIGAVGRGILVTDFWYTRILDPRTQVVTGLTRNGIWLVEDGRVVRPISNLRFTQSYLEAIAPGAVLGVSSDRVLVDGGFGASYVVPALHLASWNFTGGAKG